MHFRQGAQGDFWERGGPFFRYIKTSACFGGMFNQPAIVDLLGGGCFVSFSSRPVFSPTGSLRRLHAGYSSTTIRSEMVPFGIERIHPLLRTIFSTLLFLYAFLSPMLFSFRLHNRQSNHQDSCSFAAGLNQSNTYWPVLQPQGQSYSVKTKYQNKASVHTRCCNSVYTRQSSQIHICLPSALTSWWHGRSAEPNIAGACITDGGALEGDLRLRSHVAIGSLVDVFISLESRSNAGNVSFDYHNLQGFPSLEGLDFGGSEFQFPSACWTAVMPVQSVIKWRVI